MDIDFEKLKETYKWSMTTFNNAENKATDGMNCKICKNKGYLMEIVFHNDLNNMPYETVHECECMTERHNKQRLKKSGLEMMMEKTFDSYLARNPLQRRVKELAQKNVYEKDWFFIGGQSGFGKTHICSAIANDLLGLGQQVQYTIWTKDFKELNLLMVEDSAQFKWKKRELERVDNLYIDDLFKNRNIKDISNADVQLMFDVINYRYNNNLKTIISSEYDIESLLNIDQAIAGRIKERTGEFLLNISKDVQNNYRLNGEIVTPNKA